MDTAVYSIDGAYGKHIDVYEDRCVITTKPGLGSALMWNTSGGEKTIYYMDCVGVKFRKAGMVAGYLQLETASGLITHLQSSHSSENSFVFNVFMMKSNEKMEEVAAYIKKKVEEVKAAKNAPMQAALSPADELKKFKELLDMGIISQEEFDAKKKQVLGL